MTDNDSAGQVGRQLSGAAAGRVRAREDGSLDVMASIGGWRGLAEASLPAAGFLIAYLLTEELVPAILLAVGLGAVFTVVRLLQRGSLIQSFSGLVGVGICAAFAYFSGDARGYYEPGFVINVAYLIGFGVSVLVKWPFMGILFGLIRGEGFDWRYDAVRRRRYALATWLIAAVLAARLVVQFPLYLADNVAALGVTRLVMGVPLYALALWLGWMLTRPGPQGIVADSEAEDASP
ncbi:DUF3159 domain-containing protein [Garicola koreensis]|uniref:Hydrogenase/urease accessory protein HupE n=1 Tax=Garicola koreensis TaxID=1262554 RepID=A0A7W5TNY3_9MICC|nr:DUF3159 domain-containing protein [Garicola koreensis]MBB3666945.1 hydrogenase/urease accessory protein HupE [Garicola koreensis]